MILKYWQSSPKTISEDSILANNFLRTLLIMTLFLFTACSALSPTPSAVPVTIIEMPETDGTHITAIKFTILTGPHGLPLNLLNAHYAQEQLGDGKLGPSDFRNYIYVELEPSEIAQWQATLTSINKPGYLAPVQPLDWWVSEAAFGTMQFYETELLMGTPNGWVAINPETNQVYIYTYTL